MSPQNAIKSTSRPVEIEQQFRRARSNLGKFTFMRTINIAATLRSKSGIRILFFMILAFLSGMATACVPPVQAPVTVVVVTIVAPTAEKTPIPPDPAADPTDPPREEIKLTIIARQVALRDGPDINHREISGFYTRGTEMIVLEKYHTRDGYWFHVRAEDGTKGWLFIVWVNIDTALLDQIAEANNVLSPPPVIDFTRRPKEPTYPG